MKRILCILLGVGVLAWAPQAAAGTSVVQFQQSAIPYNLQSQRGVPIATTTNVYGSDGQLSTTDQSGNGNNPATTNQFQSFISFGALCAPLANFWQYYGTNSSVTNLVNGSNAISGVLAEGMGLPVGLTNSNPNSVLFVMRRAQVGAPYLCQAVSYYLGSTIPAPLTDIYGVLLPNTNYMSSMSSTQYWTSMPYASTNNQFYWSASAGAVFATQPGAIAVTWMAANAYPIANPPSYTNVNGSLYGAPSFSTNGGYVYPLYTVIYVVSGSPAKQPQQIYWTEGMYSSLSCPIKVPVGQVSSVNVVYNQSFPQFASSINSAISAGITNYQTLYYNNQDNCIHANNAVGQVFIELLGQPTGTNTSQFLGYEIVNVAQAPVPNQVTNYLGTQLTPYQEPTLESGLNIYAIPDVGTQYYYDFNGTYYADEATSEPTDLQMYWTDTGVAGLQWPKLFNQYVLVWPSDPTQYSYYLRPSVTNQAQASLTAVQLDSMESPSLDYQDPLDQTRAFLDEQSDKFYTWLTPGFPAQRALLRFLGTSSVRFERVFSYLAAGVETNALLNQSVITNLAAWNTNGYLDTVSYANLPYYTNFSVNVGDRISAPPGEYTNGSTGDYWAGYVNTNQNALWNAYDTTAYIDPFTNGFTAANEGSIIPVNAIPGRNQLEVWWFRPNNADAAEGFQTVYWPAVIADYTVNWPASPRKIVLASDKGSGPLDSLRANGSIYIQNDPSRPGYNPNEEHAVMLGGQAYALRDDLNLTNATAGSIVLGTNYSSLPYVLLKYTDSDGRPSMTPYLVQREDPTAGIYFDYITSAGTLLQAPMPLPLLAPPSAYNTNFPGDITNYNYAPLNASLDLPNGWTSADANGPYQQYQRFIFKDRKQNFWVFRGPNAGLPPLQAGIFSTNSNAFGPLPSVSTTVGSNFLYCIHVSRLLDSLTVSMQDLPPGLVSAEDTTNGIYITGVATAVGNYPVKITITDTADLAAGTLTLNPTISVVANAQPAVVLGPLVLSSTNSYAGEMVTFSNRPPSLAQPASSTNSFAMRYYYKTMPGFAWPGFTNPPADGSIVPYLRPVTNGAYAGDPTSSNTPSLNIVYRPVWPEIQNGLPLPVLAQGQTLTTPVNGITAVRGQDSVQVLYQQSLATNQSFHAISQGQMDESAADAVVLFDPTVEKKAVLGTNSLPASMVYDIYQGLYYFPNLPPNLISRFWYDPNGNKLVFTGQFVHDPVNGDYVMDNILRDNDLAYIMNLCTPYDVGYPFWTNAVLALSVSEYTYWQDPSRPGSYVINTNWTVMRGVGDIVSVTSSDTAVDSYALSATGPGQGFVSYIVANGNNPAYSGDPINVYVARVAPPLFQGALVVVNSANASPFSQLITVEHTADLAGRTGQYLYDWRIEPPVNGQPPALGSEPSWVPLSQSPPGPVYTLGATGIQGLTDNYISMRYGCLVTNSAGVTTNWSAWANPVLAEGWISRVTQALDPIAGQTQNLYQNAAGTTASIIQLAGTRWDGDVPLNSSSITNYGLIQLYETVLDQGEKLSINSGINYGPANQALLLAAGYLDDLYMTLGNAAWANSMNPTIGFGTDNTTYGAMATASFCFEGEVPTLLAQNLALLRGRDDSLSPGVDLPPAYNRLYWNYTYGIDAGETIYALNYNITDQNGDGVVNAADAQIMFPQGHGDAYGHYLTAMMNYYKLIMNPNFDWVPQAQTVQVLGAAVTVNYEHETKFAAAAAAVARTGRQIFDLEWRQDYQPGTAGGWGYFATNYTGQYTFTNNSGQLQKITRYWGMDHWASRVGQGTYLDWVVGNSILPYKDSNPNDQGVQIVDRQTVQDLQELPATAAALEADVDNANAGFTPLGLAQNAIPFDINPKLVTGADPQTHFEQVYGRAVQALNNAVTAFNAAQNVTMELRQQQNSLSDLQAAVAAQELAYNNQLIELYGTPYPDDVGPGGTYPQGYTGPDLIHYMYVDDAETNLFGGLLLDPATNQTFDVDIQQFPANWFSSVFNNFNFITNSCSPAYTNSDYITYNVQADVFTKPASWTDERGTIGSIQTAFAAVNAANDQLRNACSTAVSDKQALDQAVLQFDSQDALNIADLGLQESMNGLGLSLSVVQQLNSVYDEKMQNLLTQYANTLSALGLKEPLSIVITGMADGGTIPDALKTVDAQNVLTESITTESSQYTVDKRFQIAEAAIQTVITAMESTTGVNQYYQGLYSAIQALGQQENTVQGDVAAISQAQVALNGAQANYQALLAQGNRIQQERLTFRQHTAAQVQGATVADAAFLVFQNEDLERYNTLFNLAAEYAYMAANAYDYETGLLGTPAGQSYLNQIISSCALGVIQNGQPQVSGTDTGDPGLANALAEMKADWDVVKGRLGFNNPDGYGTICSLRSENYRILSGATGDSQWQTLLQNSLRPDLRADSDVANYCMQIDNGSGEAVPGIELSFGTTITDGENLFGQPLGPGDHAFSSTSFATKIFAVGVCFDGYEGMDNPVSNSGAAGTTPSDPTLDVNALSATPYVYLIPCGADSMRTPPLGDTTTVRSWNVDDVAIPLPYNIGASSFSSTPFYTSANSLSEPLFAVRKNQAFRPVSTTAAFDTSIYGATGSLQPSQYTNQRLIGRSIWNSNWKLVIPGKTLLNDPNQGLARFISTVKDIHLYFVTYSYAGN